MRKISILVLAFFLLANNAFGSPLVFTVSKDIVTDGISEIATIDTAKYSQIRIAIKAVPKGNPANDAAEFTKLTGKRIELEAEIQGLKLTFNEKHLEITRNRDELSKVNVELEKIGKRLDEADQMIGIAAVENGEEIQLLNLDERKLNDSFVIDSPPTKLRIYFKGQGKFTIYIWGQ